MNVDTTLEEMPRSGKLDILTKDTVIKIVIDGSLALQWLYEQNKGRAHESRPAGNIQDYSDVIEGNSENSEIELPASRLGVARAGELAPNFRVNNDFRYIARTKRICFHACRGIAGITKR